MAKKPTKKAERAPDRERLQMSEKQERVPSADVAVRDGQCRQSYGQKAIHFAPIMWGYMYVYLALNLSYYDYRNK